MPTNACCFSGHRELPALWLPQITAVLEEQLHALCRAGVRVFYSGGARGFDTLAAGAVLRLKALQPDIELRLMLPCCNQAEGWPARDALALQSLVAAADDVSYTADAYFQGCMHLRDRALVNASGYCLCYLARDTGGTAYTVRYAQKQGLLVVNCAALL